MQCPFLDRVATARCSVARHGAPSQCTGQTLAMCTSDFHRYCGLYMSRTHFAEAPNGAPKHTTLETQCTFLPTGFGLAPNHMWLHAGDDGVCTIGVDAFMTTIFGDIDAIRLATGNGLQQPRATFTVRGIDLDVEFPNEILVTDTNLPLHAVPQCVANDPYGTGWMFRGADPRVWQVEPSVDAGLMHGEEAAMWLRHESNQLTRFVREEVQQTGPGGEPLLMDGGRFVAGLARHLACEEIRRLHATFFAPLRSWCL